MVFVRQKSKEKHFNVAANLGLREVKGRVGIEIEVEGNKFQKSNLPPPWAYKPDGSLRGQDSAEYIYGNPQEFADVQKSLEDLWGMFEKYGSVLDDSNRTSIHVHLNVTDFYLNQLAALMGLYFMFEEPLTEWCGEHRVGNLFCLRAKDAPAIIGGIRRFVRSNMASPLRDGNHYAGFNASAIPKLGSVEIRTLRGVRDPVVIRDWVEILQKMYDFARTIKDPRTLITEFSSTGPLAFFENVFGSHGETIRRGISMSEDGLRDALYDGMRLAQDVCYARDWSDFETLDLKPDPFGRDAKKIQRRLQGEEVPFGNFGIAVSDEDMGGDPEMPQWEDEMGGVDAINEMMLQQVHAQTQPQPQVQGQPHAQGQPMSPPLTFPAPHPTAHQIWIQHANLSATNPSLPE